LLELEVDVLSLCARHNRITSANVNAVKARSVISGANNPLTPEAEQALVTRGIICLPDFVTNSGGVLGGTMSFAGIKQDRILGFINNRFIKLYLDLLIKAEKDGISIREYAEKLARERHQAIKHAVENPNLWTKTSRLFLKSYQNGLFPRSVMGKISPSYFRNLPAFK
jgi:glutamate dehydrogenase/leucine dehydrogenase